ncbi:MAG: hypothetical protein QXG64_07710 [Acidilobaceae archaeon]
MSALEYLMMLKRVLVRGRSVIEESADHFKVYLPTEYNDLWEELKNRRIPVDIIVFLPKQHQEYGISKILMKDRYIVRESGRYKVYLSKGYLVIWREISQQNQSIDLLIVFKV